MAIVNWSLPGNSSVKARLAWHRDRIEYSWLGDHVSLSDAISLEVHPTNRCNLDCSFCAYRGVRGGEQLPDEVFTRLVDDLCEMGPATKSVVFSGGGEPSLHRYLPEAIIRLTTRGIDVGVISNGVFMSPALLEAYLTSTWIRFSLDVPSAAAHVQLLSRNPDNYNKALANLRRLADAKGHSPERFPTLDLGFVITRYTQTDEMVLKCLDVAAEAGADYVMFRPLVGAPSEQITRSLDEFRDLQGRVDERAKVLGVGHQFHKFVREFEKTVKQESDQESRTCPIVQDGLIGFVAATGDVMPCYALYQHSGSKFSYGNLGSSTFTEVWRSPRREEVIKQTNATNCPYCRYQGHNAILRRMAEGDETAAAIDVNDRHWTFL